MRNSKMFRSTIIAFLFAITNLTTLPAQNFNPEEIVTTAQGYTLKMKHVLVVLNTMQEAGELSANPNQFELEQILLYLVQTFEQNPAALMAEIQTLSSGNVGTLQQNVNTPPPAQGGNGNIASQQDAEREIAKVFKKHFPQTVINYNNPQAQQLKSQMKNMLLVSNKSKTYNSGSGASYFGMTTQTILKMHLFTNGTMLFQESSRSAGGGGMGSIDSGDNGSAIQGYWSVAEVSGQICLILGDAQGVDALPMVINGNEIIIKENRYTVYANQAGRN